MKKFRSIRRIAIAALVLALTPAAASARLFWVGGAGERGCTHPDLQSAIDAAQSSAGEDTIHLVEGGPYMGPFSIVSGGITIVGGVPSCFSTNPSPSAYSTLQAPSGQRPLTVLLGQWEEVTLRHLVITTKSGTLKTTGGGIWFASSGNSRGDLVLEDCQVVANATISEGGGIFVSGGVLRLTENSIVSGNTVYNDGGISGVNGAVIDIDSSYVAANAAWADGGGIHAPDAIVRVGDSGGLGLAAGVINNIAGNDGGGIYVGEDANLASLGFSADVAITGNQARRGGGVFLDDAGMLLHRVEVNLNMATEAGGGIYLRSGATLTTEPIQTPLDGFPRFLQNRALEGAAIFAEGDQTWVGLRSGTVHDHSTVKEGAAVVAASDNAGLFFRGLYILRNRAPELFAIEGGASLALLHTSVALNEADRLVRWDGSGPGVQVLASLFSETEPFFSGLPTPQVLPQLTCVMSHFKSMLDGMPAGTDLSEVLVADPEFLDPDDGDLHLWPGSPAVDLCPYANAGGGNGGGLDSDGDSRGFDHPIHPNPPGRTYDAGADEIIFDP